MMKVVVTEFISLDGIMEDPGGAEGARHGAWTFKYNRGPEGDKFKLDELFAAEALLLGRVTYEGFARVWPTIPDQDPFVARMNGIPKYVVSSTIKESEATWGETNIIRGDVPAEIAKLKAQPGGNLLVHGSNRLVHTLIEHDLVDEYRLMVYPVILGSGKCLFPNIDRVASLKLLESKTAGDGILMLTYQPA